MADPTPRMTAADETRARDLSLTRVRPPVRVPGYEQEAFVGHGAYGEVWRAVDSNSGQKVAIKFYTRRGGLDWSALAREVEKLRYLFTDRYIVQLIKVGWESDPPYYVMEYMENGSLEDLLRDGPVPVHDAVAYFRDIATALVNAHNRGILHCDLKPANVLLDYDGKPRLADFGQSRLTNEMSPALGTLFYMAPEQADLEATPDAKWDVYALGAVMYRMLTGAPPHRDEAGATAVLKAGAIDAQLAEYRRMIAAAPVPTAHRKVEGVDAGLAAIVDKCLDVRPSHRYPNPQAVLTALDAWSVAQVRRPLLWLTGAGFAVLMMIVALVGTVLFLNTISVAEAGVLERAVEGNQFAARAEASQFAMEIQQRWRILAREARDPRLRQALAPRKPLPPADAAALDAWLKERKDQYDGEFDENARSSLWIALDRDGFQRATSSSSANRDKPYAYRDYFNGSGKDDADRTRVGGDIIKGPHRSLVYRRTSTGTWAVTFSVPVRGDGDEPAGVLAMTVDLKNKSRSETGRERLSVLVDTRPDGSGRRGVVLRHPYIDDFTGDAKALPLHYADAVVAATDADRNELPNATDYADPVGGEFAHRWLAATERVMVRDGPGRPEFSGWVIVIQEKRDDALKPIARLKQRFAIGAAIAVGFFVLLIVLVWVGMMYVLDSSSRSPVTLYLRRWAGIPPPGGTSLTGTGVMPALPP